MVKIDISNRSFILIGILLFIIVGGGIILAVDNPAVFGHSYSQIQACGEGQTLKTIGGQWQCTDSPRLSCRVVIGNVAVYGSFAYCAPGELAVGGGGLGNDQISGNCQSGTSNFFDSTPCLGLDCWHMDTFPDYCAVSYAVCCRVI